MSDPAASPDALTTLKQAITALARNVAAQDRKLEDAARRIEQVATAVQVFGRIQLDEVLKVHRLRESFAASLGPGLADMSKRVGDLEKRTRAP